MSPAARRLVTGKLVSGPSSIGISTPSPHHKSFLTPKPKATPFQTNLKFKSTPDIKPTQISASGKFDVSSGTNNGLTDDLLKIPSSRKTAIDFF